MAVGTNKNHMTCPRITRKIDFQAQQRIIQQLRLRFKLVGLECMNPQYHKYVLLGSISFQYSIIMDYLTLGVPNTDVEPPL